MEPNYNKAASAAYDVFPLCGSSASDILRFFDNFPNVFTYALDIDFLPGGTEPWDAFTCVREKGGSRQYIVVYNSRLSPSLLRRSLARELAHVVLGHDGTDPEDIWMEEANCFAYHLICDLPVIRVLDVHFRPDMRTVSASFKAMQTFPSMEALKAAIAEDQTRFSHYVGQNTFYHPSDVEIHPIAEKDIFGHWKNYSSVVVAGRKIGYCGN